MNVEIFSSKQYFKVFEDKIKNIKVFKHFNIAKSNTLPLKWSLDRLEQKTVNS